MICIRKSWSSTKMTCHATAKKIRTPTRLAKIARTVKTLFSGSKTMRTSVTSLTLSLSKLKRKLMVASPVTRTANANWNSATVSRHRRRHKLQHLASKIRKRRNNLNWMINRVMFCRLMIQTRSTRLKQAPKSRQLPKLAIRRYSSSKSNICRITNFVLAWICLVNSGSWAEQARRTAKLRRRLPKRICQTISRIKFKRNKQTCWRKYISLKLKTINR